MNKIVVTFGKSEKTRGMSFVALSRVRKLEDILINHTFFDCNRLLKISLPKYIVDFAKKNMILAEFTRTKCL
jgi:hypothetical protein